MEADAIEAHELKNEIGSPCSSDTSIEILEDSVTDRHDSFFVDRSSHQGKISDEYNLLDQRGTSSFTLSNVLSHFDESKNGDDKSNQSKTSQSCFNCDSPQHTARNCPLPREQKRILRNRNSFRNNQVRGGGNSRIHEDSTKDVVAPGRISSELREALGINKNDLPEWIYRMRKLGFIEGYPPAYRKRAAENNIFKLHTEDGIEKNSGTNDSLTINSERIIKYPGFNYDDPEFKDQKYECFIVPPWDHFVKSQQIYLNQLSVMETLKHDSNQCSPVSKKRKTMYENNEKCIDEGEILFVDVSKTTLEEGEIFDEDFLIVEETKTIQKKEKILISASDTPNNLIDSIPEMKDPETPILIPGTPIPLAKKHDNGILKPMLENFATGIQPFQHRTPLEKPRGFISKLHNIVKNVRKKFAK